MARRKRVKNKGRFAVFIIIVLLVIAAIVFLISFFAKGKKQEDKPDNTPTENEIKTEISKEEEERLALEKLRSEEYLMLANKTHPLSDGYRPDDLVEIDRFVKGVGSADTHKLRKDAAEALNKMLDAALEEGLEIRLRTGFRSYDYQTSLYNSYVDNHGKEEADTYSARPGYSEHQTGLACDLGGKSQNFALSYQFGDTDEGKWVSAHAHEYGYIIRYIDGKTVDGKKMPGEITGYVFEPWHVRYVGVEHATKIHEQGITLEEYLGLVDDAQYKD